MRKLERSECPQFLSERWKKWGINYKKNKTKQKSFKFQWPMFQGKRINILLEPLLAEATNHHCSYCDNYPIREKEDSIDHFKPKGNDAFYHLACQWENLYYSCHNCQAWKLEQYSEQLLCPDEEGYRFDKYYVYNFKDHILEPNPMGTDKDIHRAKITIKIFGLNEPGNITARRISFERYHSRSKDDFLLNDYNYRYIFE